MKNERYVVQVDGKAKSEYGQFVDAVRAGLQLKQEFPNSRIRVRDADDQPPIDQSTVELAQGLPLH